MIQKINPEGVVQIAFVRPLQGRDVFCELSSTGYTRGYSRFSPLGKGIKKQVIPKRGANELMSTYTQIYYHIVFSTKNRQSVLVAGRREKMFRFVWGIIKNKKCRLYRVNGIEDHLHILISLHPTVCLADLVKDIKTGTAKWVKENKMFPGFSNWQTGYGAFTHSHKELDGLVAYIKGQEEHHRTVSFMDELKALLHAEGIAFEERYLA